MKQKGCSTGFGGQCPLTKFASGFIYFLQQVPTALEAVKFFDHYTAKGWSIPMATSSKTGKSSPERGYFIDNHQSSITLSLSFS